MSDLLEPSTAPSPGDPDPDAAPSRRESHRRPRWGRRIVAVLLGLILLAVTAVAAFVVFLNQKVDSNVRREALLPTPTGTASPAPTGTGMNVLLIGTDNRPGETVGRSDVMVLAHVSEDRSKVYLIHFPRDIWVDIPGHGQAKLNAAYAFGGAPLLVETMQNLLGVHIDHVAKTDFEGFKAMTDAVGGVRVYSEEASSGQGSGYAIHQGWNDLDGAGALSFVRERYELSQGDISRGKRQQAFLKALLLRATSPDVLTNPVRIAQFTDAATKDLVLDQTLTMDVIRSEVFGLRGVRSQDIVFITAPFNGYGWSADGQSIDILDKTGMTNLGTAIREDKLGGYTHTAVAP